MSKEITESAGELQQGSQQHDPFAENAAVESRRCTSCGHDVPAVGKGHCPRCGRFVEDNAAAVTHGMRRRNEPHAVQQRTAELIEQVIAENGGRHAIDVLRLVIIEDFAATVAQLEEVRGRLQASGAITEKGRRRALVDVYKTLSERAERLGAKLRGDDETVITLSRPISHVPTPALERAKSLLERIERGEELSERELGQLEVLRDAISGDVQLPTPPPPVQDIATDEDDSVEPAPMRTVTPTPSDDAPDRDADLRERDPEAWRVIHYNDPNEIARRDEEATEVMLQRIGKKAPWL